MSNSTRLVRPFLRQSCLRTRPPIHLPRSPIHPNQCRNFIENPLQPSIQTLTASRTLPYPHDLLYTIIADIDQYSTFLPYCLSSTVTKWSRSTRIQQQRSTKNDEPPKEVQWPEEATLTIGWQNYRESFTSRVYCIPGRVVEAVSGSTPTTLAADEIAHHNHDDRTPSTTPSADSTDLLTHLRTRWTLHPYPYQPPPLSSYAPSGPSAQKPTRPEEATTHPAREQTDVHLRLEFAFANSVYAGLSKAVAPRVADMMVGAFEERVRGLLR